MSRGDERQPDIALEIKPELSHLAIIRKIISSIAQQLGFSEKEILQLEMAVDEACANSIEAILKLDCDPDTSRVRIEIVFHPDHLQLTIIDTCQDFIDHFQRAIRFDEQTDRTQKRGYGLRIIKTLMDEVHYIHDPSIGNKLIMMKYLRID